MARKLRVQYPGAIYHLLNRGDRREPIFLDDVDRQDFVNILGDTCVKSGWQVHAFCLMPNHFHLVVETPSPTLVAGMKWFLGIYTGRFNRRHRMVGHLFSGRYKALVVDGSSDGYLKTVCDYVHLNPARSNLLAPDQPLREYRWSSVREYLKAPLKRLAWVRVDRLFGESGIPRDSAAGRRTWEKQMESRRSQEETGSYSSLRRGWYFGEESFKKELLRQMTEHSASEHHQRSRKENQEETAQRVVQEELCRRGWTEQTLGERAKGDAEKVRIAERLRRETVMTVRWIAHRLQMGSLANVNTLLYLSRHGQTGK